MISAARSTTAASAASVSTVARLAIKFCMVDPSVAPDLRRSSSAAIAAQVESQRLRGSGASTFRTGEGASPAATALVRDSANCSSSDASALRRLAAASAVNSSSSCESTPMPAAHRRPMRRRNCRSTFLQRLSSVSSSRSESRYFCFQSVVSDTGLVSRELLNVSVAMREALEPFLDAGPIGPGGLHDRLLGKDRKLMLLKPAILIATLLAASSVSARPQIYTYMDA